MTIASRRVPGWVHLADQVACTCRGDAWEILVPAKADPWKILAPDRSACGRARTWSIRDIPSPKLTSCVKARMNPSAPLPVLHSTRLALVVSQDGRTARCSTRTSS